MGLVTFRELLEDAFLDPDRIDYAELRALYVASPDCPPAPRDPGRVDRLHAQLRAGAWEEAIQTAEALLEGDPMAISLRLAYARALDGVGDDWEAATQRAFANGCLQAILASGDGRTPGTAIVVLDDRELHLALEHLGTRACQIRVALDGGRWIASVVCGDGRVRYFDVAVPRGGLADGG